MSAQVHLPEMQDADAAQACVIIAGLSFREAKARFRIGYKTWRSIKQGEQPGWSPARGGAREDAAKAQRVLDSVKAMPHLSTPHRAEQLGLRTETVQRILASRGLSKLNARLLHAGYQVSVVRPLALARKRRIVAAAPGLYTCIDFKAFGMVRRRGGQEKVPLCGCVVVDQLTAFATVLLDPRESAEAACLALELHRHRAPFRVRGLILSDNGAQFLSDRFMLWCAEHGYVQRTTQFNHPWSNGKVESLNRTLKYQCAPALVAGLTTDLNDLQKLLDIWLKDYNEQRPHGGWVNRGLPPAALARLWAETKGTPVERLLKIGALRPKDVKQLRVMGQGKDGKVFGGTPLATAKGQPFAYVLDGSTGLVEPVKPVRVSGYDDERDGLILKR